MFWEIRYLAAVRIAESQVDTLRELAEDVVGTVAAAASARLERARE